MSFRRSCATVVSLTALLFVLTLTSSAQFRTVTVENAPTNPVPVQVQNAPTVSGSVSITGTPNVSVTNTPSVKVTSLPAVTVSGTPTVTVANASSSPVLVRDVDSSQDQTFGSVVQLNQGTTSVSDSTITLPACSAGQNFLVKSFYVTADVFNGSASTVNTLGAWGAFLITRQLVTNGSFSIPLHVYGNGPQAGSVSLPAGVVVDQPNPTFEVTLFGGATAANFFDFTYLITGHCGTAPKF